ncbi:MAG: hypothetical protein A3F42_05990 [Gammaproteobacteria bacterium RIFCSPHIGHO2_12_FULL_37_34]|nr:MAG: hypothetical protein A3F42_05990 [Gammaproteobacteria bacterium RIFCSPHIGHO2_12_FULL_37_34]
MWSSNPNQNPPPYASNNIVSFPAPIPKFEEMLMNDSYETMKRKLRLLVENEAYLKAKNYSVTQRIKLKEQVQKLIAEVDQLPDHFCFPSPNILSDLLSDQKKILATTYDAISDPCPKTYHALKQKAYCYNKPVAQIIESLLLIAAIVVMTLGITFSPMIWPVPVALGMGMTLFYGADKAAHINHKHTAREIGKTIQPTVVAVR